MREMSGGLTRVDLGSVGDVSAVQSIVECRVVSWRT
jgi:hypothetical protein